MSKLVLFSIFLCSIFAGFGQKTLGDSLRNEGQLEQAIEAYKTRSTPTPKRSDEAYDIARTFSLLYQFDSAFHYLYMALEQENSLWPLADSDLFALSNDPRWKSVEDRLLEVAAADNPQFDKIYASQLLRLIMRDQALDYYIDQAKGHFMKKGSIPHWYYPIGAYKKNITAGNFEEMMGMISSLGWPKYSTVGEIAADAPLLAINHHESDSVRIAHLASIKSLCLEGEGSCVEYAKIHDRILVNTGKPQLYGMQFKFGDGNDRALIPFPISDPEYVDERRKKIGLESLKKYLKRKINYDWDITQKSH